MITKNHCLLLLLTVATMISLVTASPTPTSSCPTQATVGIAGGYTWKITGTNLLNDLNDIVVDFYREDTGAYFVTAPSFSHSAVGGSEWLSVQVPPYSYGIGTVKVHIQVREYDIFCTGSLNYVYPVFLNISFGWSHALHDSPYGVEVKGRYLGYPCTDYYTYWYTYLGVDQTSITMDQSYISLHNDTTIQWGIALPAAAPTGCSEPGGGAADKYCRPTLAWRTGGYTWIDVPVNGPGYGVYWEYPSITSLNPSTSIPHCTGCTTNPLTINGVRFGTSQPGFITKKQLINNAAETINVNAVTTWSETQIIVNFFNQAATANDATHLYRFKLCFLPSNSGSPEKCVTSTDDIYFS